MSSDLLNLEANYAWYVQRYESSPYTAHQTELAMKQILIDQMRRDEKLPLRWFTSAELEELGDDADKWPEKPRQPLALAPISQEPKPKPVKEPPKRVNWQGETTITLDSLLKQLQELRKVHDGQTPVVGVEFGGLSSLNSAGMDETYDCIVIE